MLNLHEACTLRGARRREKRGIPTTILASKYPTIPNANRLEHSLTTEEYFS